MSRKTKISPMDEILSGIQEMTSLFSDLVGYKAETKAQRAYRARKAIEDKDLAKEYARYCDELLFE